LACEVRVLRSIPRTVFKPVPNVDSVLVSMRRRAEGAGAAADSRRPGGASQLTPALRTLVAGAFAHRRKTLAGSLALAGGGSGRSREQVREALQTLGHPADVRAERLSPTDFRELARLLARSPPTERQPRRS